MSTKSAPDPVRFGPFTLQLETGDLKCDGVPVRLRRQPAQILTLLVARAGELVTRQEVIDRVWPGTTVEFDQGLNSCIRQLRTALGDTAEAPRWIETLPRQGYRFIGAVSPVERPEPAAAPSTVRKRLLGGAAGLALLALAIAVGTRSRSAPADPGADRTKLAVLPLAVEPADSALAALGDVLLEDLIDHLARLDPSKLGVIARTSVARYRESAQTAQAVGSELGVEYLVEGSLRRDADGTVRVAVRLVRSSDQTQVWATRWQGPPEALLAGTDTVAAAVVTALLPRVLLPQGEAPREPGPAARAAFLEARYLLARSTLASVRASVGRFREVLLAEPDFAPAAAGLAKALYRLGRWAAADSAAQNALSHDPQNVSASLTLADIALLRDWDWDASEGYYRRALQAAPGDAEAHNGYGFQLAAMGRISEAVSHAELAQRLDPVSPVVNGDLGYVYLWADRPDQAAAQCRKAVELAGSTPAAEECLVAAFAALNRPDSSLAHATRLARLVSGGDDESPTLPFPTLEAYWRWVLERNPTGADGSAGEFARAMAFAALNDADRGTASLAAGVRAHRALRDSQEIAGVGLYVVLGVDRRFDPLRSRPEFDAVMDQVGIPPTARRRLR